MQDTTLKELRDCARKILAQLPQSCAILLSKVILRPQGFKANTSTPRGLPARVPPDLVSNSPTLAITCDPTACQN